MFLRGSPQKGEKNKTKGMNEEILYSSDKNGYDGNLHAFRETHK